MTDCHIIEEASFCLFISPGIYIDHIISAVLLAGTDCSLLRKNANNNYTGVNAQTLANFIKNNGYNSMTRLEYRHEIEMNNQSCRS